MLKLKRTFFHIELLFFIIISFSCNNDSEEEPYSKTSLNSNENKENLDSNDTKKSLNQKQNKITRSKDYNLGSDFLKKYSKTKYKCKCGNLLKSEKISQAFSSFDDKNYSKTGIIKDTQESRINGKGTYIRCDICKEIMVNGKNNALPIWSCKSPKHNGQTYDICIFCANKLSIPSKKQCSSCHGSTIFPLINGKCNLCIPYLKSIDLTNKIQSQFDKEIIKYKEFGIEKLKILYDEKIKKINLDSKSIKTENIIELIEILISILTKATSNLNEIPEIKEENIKINFIKVKTNNTLFKDIKNKDLITESFEKLSIESLSKLMNKINLKQGYKKYFIQLIKCIKLSKEIISFNLTDYTYISHQYYQGQTPPTKSSEKAFLFFKFNENIYGIEKKVNYGVGL